MAEVVRYGGCSSPELVHEYAPIYVKKYFLVCYFLVKTNYYDCCIKNNLSISIDIYSHIDSFFS